MEATPSPLKDEMHHRYITKCFCRDVKRLRFMHIINKYLKDNFDWWRLRHFDQNAIYFGLFHVTYIYELATLNPALGRCTGAEEVRIIL